MMKDDSNASQIDIDEEPHVTFYSRKQKPTRIYDFNCILRMMRPFLTKLGSIPIAVAAGTRSAVHDLSGERKSIGSPACDAQHW